ncbi:hypothetical protein A2U01_0118469, partial [Trifolium medium]|nr:hypothetical protein [Trifolium medium]
KLVKDLEVAEAKLVEVTHERDALLVKVKGLEERVCALEDKLKEAGGRGVEEVITEEERAVDRAGVYA